MFTSKIKPTAANPEVLAVQKAETNLASAQLAASKAADESARLVAAAEADATQARAALQVVEEAESRRPAQEREAAALARAAEIDSALGDAAAWLAGALKERNALAGEIYSASRALGQSNQLHLPSVEPHTVMIRPGSADIHVSWPR